MLTLKKQKDQALPEGSYRFFPDHVLTEINLGIFFLYLCTILSIVFPLHLIEKANPLVTPEHIKPEWYFFPMYRWIKMTPESVGIFVPALVVLIFVLWPFVDRFIGKVTGSKNVATWIGVAGMVFVTCLLVIEAMS